MLEEDSRHGLEEASPAASGPHPRAYENSWDGGSAEKGHKDP